MFPSDRSAWPAGVFSLALAMAMTGFGWYFDRLAERSVAPAQAATAPQDLVLRFETALLGHEPARHEPAPANRR